MTAVNHRRVETKDVSYLRVERKVTGGIMIQLDARQGAELMYRGLAELEDERGRLHPEQELRMQVVDIEQGEGRWP